MRAFNVDFYKEAQNRLVDDIEAAASSRFSYVLAANFSQLVCLNQHPELQQAYAKASHCICDNPALLPAFKLCKRDVPAVIPLRDLAETFLTRASQQGRPITIVGGEPRLVRILRRRYPGVTINHHYPPVAHMHIPDVQEACLRFISEHPAPIVLFSLPCPAQELLAMQARDRGSIEGVGLCVGQALERLVEDEEPAPAWVQTLRLGRLHAKAQALDCSITDLLRFAPIAARQYWVSRAEQGAAKQPVSPQD